MNALNQHGSREVPGYMNVLGTASNNATVTLWGDNGAYAATARKSEYFRGELYANNSTGAVWLTITNVAVLNDGGNPDIVTNTVGKTFLPKTPETFAYDLDGNLTRDGSWTNTWNAENRRVTIESRSTLPAAARMREQWTHLADGRWIERIVSTNNGSSYYPAFTNRYVWDGQVLLAVLDHTNGLVMSFTRGSDLSGTPQGAGGVGGVLAVCFKTNGTHFTCYDGNGNVTALVNATNGSESARYEYGPFAEPIRATGPMAKLNPIRFSTQYADDVTGDVKYLFRDYDALTGRWLSRDPIGERFLAPAEGQEDSEDSEPQRGAFVQRVRGGDSGNLYSFVSGDPIGRIDPVGLITFKGCKPEQEEAMKKAFKENCGKVNSSLFSCCMKAGSGVYAMRKICDQDNLVVKCHQKETFWNGCKGRCGWTHWARGTIDNKPVIHICPAGLNEDGCPAVGCTVFHEMMHTTNWFNDERSGQKAEVCLGCPPTDLWPGGPPPMP